MPRFMDHHPKMPQMSPAQMAEGMKMMERMKADILAKKADENGVTPLNVLMGANGESWCLTEAANATSVIKAHAAKGVALTQNDIVEITTLI